VFAIRVLPRVLPFTQFNPGFTQLPRVKLGKTVQRFYPPTLKAIHDFITTIIIRKKERICSAPFTDKIRTVVHYIVSKTRS